MKLSKFPDSLRRPTEAAIKASYSGDTISAFWPLWIAFLILYTVYRLGYTYGKWMKL